MVGVGPNPPASAAVTVSKQVVDLGYKGAESGTTQVRLIHPVSSRTLLEAAARRGLVVDQVFHRNKEFAGIHVVGQTLDPTQAAMKYDMQVHRQFDTTPRVIGALVRGTATSQRALVQALAKEPIFKPKPASHDAVSEWEALQGHMHGGSILESLESTADISASQPWPANYSYLLGSSTTSFTIGHKWLSDRNLSTIHDDWGYETNWYMWDRTAEGIRPTCDHQGGPFPADYENFYLNRFNGFTLTISLNRTNPDPMHYGMYADDFDNFDSCQTAAFGLGIGFPQLVERAGDGSLTLVVTIAAEPGDVASSEISSAQKVVSDDCDDLGSEPASSCMNLNHERDYPGGPPEVWPGGFPEETVEIPWPSGWCLRADDAAAIVIKDLALCSAEL